MPGGYPPAVPAPVPLPVPVPPAVVELPVSPWPPVAGVLGAPATADVELDPEVELPAWLCAVDGVAAVGSCLVTLSTALGTSRPAGPVTAVVLTGGAAVLVAPTTGTGSTGPGATTSGRLSSG